MFEWKHTLAVLLLFFMVGPVCAFTFSYGKAFTIKGISQQDGRLQMPLYQKKYSNTKVLTKPLYTFLLACTDDCTYPVKHIDFVSLDTRQAFSNPHLMIATLAFNQEITLTFLVHKQTDKITVTFPKEVLFTDKELQQQVEKYLNQLVKPI